MSWFWGKSSTQDPIKSLDNDLKQFLDEQQPKPYVPAEAPKPEPIKPSTIKENADNLVKLEDKPLPKESLFQDGRYKHLWATYVPQNQILEATTTPAERVLTAKKDRRQMINRAALENCAFEEELKLTCMSNGSAANRLRARMTMCSQETKAFNRCYQLQAKFLQALGYLSSSQTTAEEEERIQMHADKLYHRMMDYEASVDQAKREGKSIPPLASVFNPNRPAPTIEEINLPNNIEKTLKKPLREMQPHERELAARAVLQETKIAQTYADDFFKYTTTLNEGRQERQKRLVGLLGETVGKFFIPDPPEEHQVKSFTSKELDRDVWTDESTVKTSNVAHSTTHPPGKG